MIYSELRVSKHVRCYTKEIHKFKWKQRITLYTTDYTSEL